MKKYFKHIAALFLVFSLAFSLFACGGSGGGGNQATRPPRTTETQTTTKDTTVYTETISVLNAADYIDMNTVADFEREYKIKVVYEEFASNEEMYSTLLSKPNSYDVLVPSDYMVDRLVKENKLEKLDASKITNKSNIASEYLSPVYDSKNEYSVPYMVGTLGILYNKRLVSSPPDSWQVLWDAQYKGQILMWDSVRDCLGATLKMLGFSMNSGNDNELSQAKTRLLSQKSLVKAYAEEEIRDIMIADEAALALIYSGEAKIAIDQNPNLAYVIPKEGANKWVDSFVIVKGTAHLDAAQKFVNFMCRPNIALRNMSATGYTSPVSGSWAEFCDNTIMFPSKEELNRSEAFLYDSASMQKYTAIWKEIRN